MKSSRLTSSTTRSGIRLLGVLLFFSAISLPPDSGHATTSPRVRSATAGNTDRNGEIIRGPRGKFEVALTFDADAKADCFDDLIATLEKAHVHSTFFVTGKWAQQNRVCAEAIPKHGHEIGNHTWNHLDLTKQSDAVVREELVRAEHLINEICRSSPRPLWRAPFGARDARVLQIANNLGYRCIYWTVDSLDSIEPQKSPEFLIHRITEQPDANLDGAILRLTVGERGTADALPAIIANLQSRGFQLVTVSELLR